MTFDPKTWPREHYDGRFLCLPEHPMPIELDGQGYFWMHPKATVVGSSYDGADDEFKCPVCGIEWTKENPK